MLVHVSNLAKEDLVNIWLYGESQWGVNNADQYLDSINLFIQELTLFPQKFPLREQFHPFVRFAPYKSHLIIYIDKPQSILVIRVLHQSMNIPNYLG